MWAWFQGLFFQIKRKQLDFNIFGGQQNKNKRNEKRKWDEIGQMLVSGALDDTKTIGKAGADIVEKSGPEKPSKSKEKSDVSLDVSSFFPNLSVDLA